jgi:hypothetical protein
MSFLHFNQQSTNPTGMSPMKIKLFAAAAAVALSAFAGQVQAAGETWTVTTTGHIASGRDWSGVFGTTVDLAGMSYTQSITASIDPEQWSSGGSGSYNLKVEGSGPSFTDTVTINGNTVTFTTIGTFQGRQFVSNGFSQGGPSGIAADGILSYQIGMTADGNQVYAENNVYNYYGAFVPALLLGQTLSQDTTGPLFGTDIHFGVSGNQQAFFDGSGDSIVVTTTALPVPEPETYAMLLAGLGLVGFATRRKRKTS